jgi:hypothetical protein
MGQDWEQAESGVEWVTELVLASNRLWQFDKMIAQVFYFNPPG